MDDDKIDKRKIAFLEHYRELRNRVLSCFIVFFIVFFIAFLVKDTIFNFFLWPYHYVFNDAGAMKPQMHLQSIAIWETFLTKIKLCLYSAFALTLPFTLYHFYHFVRPALYKKERVIVFRCLFLVPFLFLLGAAFIYFGVARIILWFSLLQQDTAIDGFKIAFNLTISNYLAFIVHFTLIFGIIFQLPLILFCLYKIGWIGIQVLQKNRRWAILISGVFSAIITPPDLFTMLCVFLPLILLYECSILILKFIDKSKRFDCN